MNRCERPIDPVDAQALAAGAEPIVSHDAEAHVRECSSCRELVEGAGRFATSLEVSLPDEDPDTQDLALRVLRLRAFSRREKRDFALWRGPAGLAIAVFLSGVGLATLPVLTGREQASLGLAAAAPLLALFQSLVRSIGEGAAAAPVALDSLAQTFRAQTSLGLSALALLAPASLGLKWALARARR